MHARPAPSGHAHQVMVYDGSFAGWLSAVFDVYEYRFGEVSILPAARAQHGLFSATHEVHTDEAKSLRVWKGLQQKISRNATTSVYRTFLSEEKGVEDRLLQYVRRVFANRLSIEYDYSDPIVMYVVSTAKKVHREKHRMEAFVRFREAADGLFFAIIDPDFNVLPLIQPHFQDRYADQRWLIYDTRRKTGLYYDLHSTQPVGLGFEEPEMPADPAAGHLHEAASSTASVDAAPTPAASSTTKGGTPVESKDDPSFTAEASSPGAPSLAILDEKEELYHQLWQLYFDSVNIAARRNMRLHIRHMPLRYWKYLPEKQPR